MLKHAPSVDHSFAVLDTFPASGGGKRLASLKAFLPRDQRGRWIAERSDASRRGVIDPIRLAMLFLALAPISAAHAQSIEERLRDQLRATVNQLHQLQDDQAQLQAQKAQAEQERDQLKTQLAAAKAEAAHNRSNGAQARELEGEVSKYKDQYTQETATAQKAQVDHDKLQADLAKAQALVGACEEKNTALLKTGNEILDVYEDFDIGDAVGAREPFFQTMRVELENEAQGFDDKLRSGKFDPDKVKLPTAAPVKSN
jgi:hypothetical protein